MTDVLIAPQISDPELDTEPPKEAHLVRKEDQMRGYVGGEPIQALCGFVWVPSHTPDNLPVCERCTGILKQIASAQGGMN